MLKEHDQGQHSLNSIARVGQKIHIKRNLIILFGNLTRKEFYLIYSNKGIQQFPKILYIYIYIYIYLIVYHIILKYNLFSK